MSNGKSAPFCTVSGPKPLCPSGEKITAINRRGSRISIPNRRFGIRFRCVIPKVPSRDRQSSIWKRVQFVEDEASDSSRASQSPVAVAGVGSVPVCAARIDFSTSSPRPHGNGGNDPQIGRSWPSRYMVIRAKGPALQATSFSELALSQPKSIYSSSAVDASSASPALQRVVLHESTCIGGAEDDFEQSLQCFAISAIHTHQLFC